MRPPTCVACALPVLELLGQFATLPPYLIVAGSPPAQTAGTWHLPCLRTHGVGEQWAAVLERNYLDVRQYALVAREPRWTVIRHPRTGEVLALGHSGGILPLSGHGPAFETSAGRAYRVREAEYWLEWDQPLIAAVQERLRRTGSVPVRDIAGRLGIEQRLVHPEVLVAASFQLDEELVPDWQSTVVGAPVEYAVHLPDELAAYYDGPS